MTIATEILEYRCEGLDLVDDDAIANDYSAKVIYELNL